MKKLISGSLCAALLIALLCGGISARAAFGVALTGGGSYGAGSTIEFVVSSPDYGVNNSYEIRAADSGTVMGKGTLGDLSKNQTATAPNADGTYILTVFNGQNRSGAEFSVYGGRFSELSHHVETADNDEETPMCLRIRWSYNVAGMTYNAWRTGGDAGYADVTSKIFQKVDGSFDLNDSDALAVGEYEYTIQFGSDSIKIYITTGGGGGSATPPDQKDWMLCVFELHNPDFKVGGNSVRIDPANAAVTPVMIKNRLYLPIRALVENTGGSVDFNFNNPNKREVYLHYRSLGKQITLVIGKEDYYMDGSTANTDTPPIIVNDRTLLGLRLLEKIGCKISWDETTNTTATLLIPVR